MSDPESQPAFGVTVCRCCPVPAGDARFLGWGALPYPKGLMWCRSRYLSQVESQGLWWSWQGSVGPVCHLKRLEGTGLTATFSLKIQTKIEWKTTRVAGDPTVDSTSKLGGEMGVSAEERRRPPRCGGGQGPCLGSASVSAAALQSVEIQQRPQSIRHAFPRPLPQPSSVAFLAN